MLSFAYDRQKTIAGMRKGLLLFFKILPTLLSVIIIVSIVLYLTPNAFFLKYFGDDSGVMGYVFAALIGAVTLIPGFFAYPVCGFLIQSGVSYPVDVVIFASVIHSRRPVRRLGAERNRCQTYWRKIRTQGNRHRHPVSHSAGRPIVWRVSRRPSIVEKGHQHTKCFYLFRRFFILKYMIVYNNHSTHFE